MGEGGGESGGEGGGEAKGEDDGEGNGDGEGETVEELTRQWVAAKRAKDYTTADALRSQLRKVGMGC